VRIYVARVAIVKNRIRPAAAFLQGHGEAACGSHVYAVLRSEPTGASAFSQNRKGLAGRSQTGIELETSGDPAIETFLFPLDIRLILGNGGRHELA